MTPTSREKYRQFIAQFPGFPVFAYDWYLDSTCGAGEWDVVFLEKEGKSIAALPYYLKRKGPFRYITMPPLTKFMGPFLLPEYQGEPSYYQAIFELLPKVSSFTQNFFYPVANDFALPLKKFYSYRLQGIQDLEKTRAKFARYYRNSILKKTPALLSIRHDLGIEAYYEINKKTYARQAKEPPFSFALLQKNIAALEANNAGKIFFAVDAQGRIHAAALLVWDRHTAWYHSAGGDPELRKSGAGVYVVWEMIRYAAEHLHLDHFDFAGSMIPAIEKIWTNFGAEKREYFHLEHHFSRWFVLGQRVMGVLGR